MNKQSKIQDWLYHNVDGLKPSDFFLFWDLFAFFAMSIV